MDSSALELSVEASQTKGSEPLSLTDDSTEVMVQDSVPADISLDATVIKDDNDEAKAVATIPGWFSQIKWNNIFPLMKFHHILFESEVF